MARLYQNFASGRLDAGIVAGDTAISSPGLANLLAVSGTDYITLVLDPTGVAGNPEVIRVTAHTALATTATVARAFEGTTARSHAVSTLWVAAWSRADALRWETFGVTPAAVALAAAEGTSAAYARADHVHTLAVDSVTSAAIAADAVGASEIAAGAVGTSELADGSVTRAKIATGLRLISYVADATALAALTPTKGDVAYQIDQGRFLVYQGATLGWTPPWWTAWGVVASGQVIDPSSSTTGVVGATVDVAGLTVTYTAVAQRRYRVSARVPFQSTAGGDEWSLSITDSPGTSTLAFNRKVTSQSASAYLLDVDGEENGLAAGATTRKVRIARFAGAGTGSSAFSVQNPGRLTVEDIGPVAAPV